MGSSTGQEVKLHAAAPTASAPTEHKKSSVAVVAAQAGVVPPEYLSLSGESRLQETAAAQWEAGRYLMGEWECASVRQLLEEDAISGELVTPAAYEGEFSELEEKHGRNAVRYIG